MNDRGCFTDQQRRELAVNGFVVLPNVLPEADCERWAQLLDAAWLRNRMTHAPHPDEKRGVRFVPNPLRHAVLFERCLVEPCVLEAAQSMLGAPFIAHVMNSRRVDPGYGQQPLHELRRRRGRPFSVCNTLWCLDEFTADNGSTRVLPGSHLEDRVFLDRMGDPLSRHPDECHVVAPRGSVLVFNAQLIHAGSANRTSRPRRSIQCNFAVLPAEPVYPWNELPEYIRNRLSPLARELLGLPPHGRRSGPSIES
jgi:hypothetical protein